MPPEWARSGTHGPTGTARAALIRFGPPLVQLARVGRLGNVKHRNPDHNPELTEAVFQYGSDGHELSVVEAKRLMSEVEAIMNGGGSGLIRATIDGAERAFLISAGALVTFHVPIAAPGEDRRRSYRSLGRIPSHGEASRNGSVPDARVSIRVLGVGLHSFRD
ncbi:MAG: hypothetical protein K0Q46_5554 [Rhodococcus erythropolis]|nr:hypothetical protein [Rhodococcus erythropolis]